jgi:hypothetical protein
MKLQGWLLTAVAAGSVVYGVRGGCVNSTAPDEELADHFTELCEIAKDNVEAPKKGVKKLGGYLARHLDDIFSDFGSTIVTIEKIRDDKKHDDRARLARDRMQKPWIACQRDWERFWTAVDQDPEASEMANHAAERLGRTFEIIFSSTNVRLRDLPTAFTKNIVP